MDQPPERDVVLYTAAWCGACLPAHRFLQEHGIEYRSIDIDEEPEAAEELHRETGKRGIPFLRVDGTWVRAYEPGGGPFPRERLEEVLGLS